MTRLEGGAVFTPAQMRADEYRPNRGVLREVHPATSETVLVVGHPDF